MTSSRKALAVLFLTVVGLSQAQEEPNNDAQDDIELESMFHSPDNKFELTKLFAGQYYQNTYKKINDHLVDNLETPDPESNLKFALEWLNAEKAKSSSSNNLIEALTQFTALLKTDHRCDRVAYAILVKNDRATNHVTHTCAQPLGLRRIDSIIRSYAIKHAKDCLPSLPERYEKKLATMDRDSVKKVEEALKDDLTTRNDRIGTWELVFHLLRDSPNEQKYLRKVKNEKTGRLEINETKLKQVLQRALTDIRAPCKYYVKELGPDVFSPAFYDKQMCAIWAEWPKVRSAMVRFNMCKRLFWTKQETLLSDLKSGIH